MTQSARIVVVDVIERRALRQDLKQLVDLLLVFSEGVAHVRVAQRERHLRRGRVLIERNRNCAKALCSGDRRVDARSIGADEGKVITALEAGLGECASE